MKSTTETVIIPHPGETKRLARAQKALCAAALEAGIVCAPALPLYVRGIRADSDGRQGTDTGHAGTGALPDAGGCLDALRGAKALTCTLSVPEYADGAFAVRAQLHTEVGDFSGMLVLAIVLSGDGARLADSTQAVEVCTAASAGEFPLRLPVCRVAEAAFTESGRALQWEVTESRWVKKR